MTAFEDRCQREDEQDRLDMRDWKYEVSNGDTVLGFAEWLAHRREADGEPAAFVVENLVQYDMTEQEASVLRAFGFIWPAEDADNPGTELTTGEHVTTAFVWETLGLEADRAFELFDAVLGREPAVTT